MRLLVAALVLLLACSAGAHSYGAGEIQVRHPWSRATAPGAKVAAGYLEIRNGGAQPDRLLGASTPVAERVELHITQRDGEVVRMRQVKALDLPARSRVALEPAGTHLMLVNLARPLVKGERFALTLRFERAGEVRLEMEVQEMGSRHPRH